MSALPIQRQPADPPPGLRQRLGLGCEDRIRVEAYGEPAVAVLGVAEALSNRRMRGSAGS